jgi:hypothetical protein
VIDDQLASLLLQYVYQMLQHWFFWHVAVIVIQSDLSISIGFHRTNTPKMFHINEGGEGHFSFFKDIITHIVVF